jgi:hypothetical protein
MAHSANTRCHHVHDELHPRIYEALVALTIWLVISIWAFFGSGSYFGLSLAIISVFFLVIVGIPTLLWLTWRRNAASGRHAATQNFSAWTGEEFRTWSGGLSGKEAALQILLPIAAVSFGMTIFGLVYYLDVPHVGY